MISCNVISPQLFWWKSLRRSIPVMFVVSIFVNIGMWFERFVIIATSLHRDFLPVNWDNYTFKLADYGILFGSFGLFSVLFLLFLRFIPMVSISEVKPCNQIGKDGGHHG